MLVALAYARAPLEAREVKMDPRLREKMTHL
jgi:hypothetical protein